MGHREFGNLTKVNKQVYFGISSFEQKIFPFYFSKGIPNTLRRLKRQLFLITPGFGIIYGIYRWGINAHDQSTRKNPADFANDN